jgi:hypothetical protein
MIRRARKDVAAEGKEPAQASTVDPFAPAHMAGASAAGNHEGDATVTELAYKQHTSVLLRGCLRLAMKSSLPIR